MLPGSRLCGNRVTENHLLFFSRILQRNKIKSITKKAFEGLEELEHLWVKPPQQSCFSTPLYSCLTRARCYCWMIKDSRRLLLPLRCRCCLVMGRWDAILMKSHHRCVWSIFPSPVQGPQQEWHHVDTPRGVIPYEAQSVVSSHEMNLTSPCVNIVLWLMYRCCCH